MASVFVIEQGSYSDYHVVGVFSTRENAETVLAALKAATESYYDTPGIAEWPLDPAIDALRAGLKRYIAWTCSRMERWNALQPIVSRPPPSRARCPTRR
jgi:hypothetical protein